MRRQAKCVGGAVRRVEHVTTVTSGLHVMCVEQMFLTRLLFSVSANLAATRYYKCQPSECLRIKCCSLTNQMLHLVIQL